MVNAEAMDLFHGQMLRKKMKKNIWKEYWVELRADSLVFINENERKIAGVITLTERTTCEVLGRKTSSSQLNATDRESKQMSDRKHHSRDGTQACKFKLRAKRGVHLLKTDCKSSCEKWIEAISRVVQNMWDNSAIQIRSESSTRIKKQGFKNEKPSAGKGTITNRFSYCNLSEEVDDVYDLGRNRGKTTGAQHTRGLMSTKDRLEKWIINFPSHVVSRGKSAKYGVLVEDTID